MLRFKVDDLDNKKKTWWLQVSQSWNDAPRIFGKFHQIAWVFDAQFFFQIVWVFGLQILGREPSLGIPLVRTLVHSSFRYPFYQNICKNGLVMEISFKFGNIIFFGKKSFEAENSNRKKYVLSISRWWFHGAHSYEKHFLLSQTIF